MILNNSQAIAVKDAMLSLNNINANVNTKMHKTASDYVIVYQGYKRDTVHVRHVVSYIVKEREEYANQGAFFKAYKV